MRKQTQLLSKSKLLLLTENTKMRKQTQLLSKSKLLLRKQFKYFDKLNRYFYKAMRLFDKVIGKYT
jgi:hypothetical protein